MEKELKVSELAALWNTSVNTAWNRIKKHNLITVKKPSENNQEITYVTVSEEILNLYIKSNNNNLNNNVNNTNYEELLTPNNNDNNIINQIIELNNNFNNKLSTLTDELIEAKSKQLLLTDKADREGYYVNEINTLKKDNDKLNNDNYKLKNIISILLISLLSIVIIFLLVLFIVVNKPVSNNDKPVQVQQVQPINKPAPQPVKAAAKPYKK